ncbi:MAG: hypothetical protein IJI40_04120 [Firmicutes bacterium]|nr:hypothetical protein [Bacillota bacterium]MBQ6606090.1 hypothetical protein [Bacillota bacterium]
MKYARWIRRAHLFKKDEYICSSCKARFRRAGKTCPCCGAAMKKTKYDPRWVDEIEDVDALLD